MPEQKSGNLQVINARIKQDVMYRAFGWENEVAYQLSSDKAYSLCLKSAYIPICI